MLSFRKFKGFTLVELLIVIAIVGILVAIALPMYRVKIFRARLLEVTNSMSATATAVAAYYQENRQWPGNNGNANAIGNNLGVYVPTGRANWSTGGAPTTITATITNISSNYPTIDGCTIQLIANTSAEGAILWSWGGNIDTLFKPKN